MAKQTINIGAAANDGTGDPIRTAFGKVNDNFTEIYTANTGVNTGDQNLAAYATTAAVAAGYQPLDSDLTAIAALTTTAYGRALLSTADAPTLRTAIGLGQTDAPTFLGLALTGTTNTLLRLNTNKYLGTDSSQVYLYDSGFGAAVVSLNNNGGLAMRSDWIFGWTGSGSALGAYNTALAQDAPGILAQRNGTAKQVHRVYNTFLGTTANEWGGFDWLTTANTLRIGTEHGGTGQSRPIDFVVGGVVRMSIATTGLITTSASLIASNTVVCGASSNFEWNTRSTLSSSADGLIKIANYTGTDFNRLQLGGTTSAFPSIKRNGTGIDIRLADDSAHSFINAQDFYGYNSNIAKLYLGGAGAIQVVSTGYIAICSSATNVFTQDTFLSRNAPGVWQMGTSSTNATADLRLRSVIQQPPATITPANNGDLVVEATSNTLLTFKFKGSDGTVRSGTMVVA